MALPANPSRAREEGIIHHQGSAAPTAASKASKFRSLFIMFAVPSLALIGGRRLDQLALKALRPDCFQHLLQRDTLGMITNVTQVFLQIDVHRLNAGKPCQGFLDPIGSGVSGNVLPLDHALDIEGNFLDIHKCRRVCSFGQRMGGGTILCCATGHQ